MPDARERAEAVARWCGWVYDPSMPADIRWQAPRGDLVDAAPAYWRSRDLMEPVEALLAERGLLRRYREELESMWRADDMGMDRAEYLIRATALQRLAAAARVIEEVSR